MLFRSRFDLPVPAELLPADLDVGAHHQVRLRSWPGCTAACSPPPQQRQGFALVFAALWLLGKVCCRECDETERNPSRRPQYFQNNCGRPESVRSAQSQRTEVRVKDVTQGQANTLRIQERIVMRHSSSRKETRPAALASCCEGDRSLRQVPKRGPSPRPHRGTRSGPRRNSPAASRRR